VYYKEGGGYMNIPFREFIEILSVGLLHYYKTYRGITLADTPRETKAVYELSNMIIDEIKTRFAYMGEHIESISLFEFPYEVSSSDGIPDLESIKFGTEYVELLVKFIQSMNYRVPNAYIILSINMLPFDGLTITHGMITSYFNHIY
jgi:hypothetical protein